MTSAHRPQPRAQAEIFPLASQARPLPPAGGTAPTSGPALGIRIWVALLLAAAAGWTQAESSDTRRLQLERDQAARQLELKLEQLQFERRARRAPSTGPASARPKTSPRGTRLPLASIPSDTDADAGSAALAERRQLRTLFDRERFEQRELQLKQQQRLMTDRDAAGSAAGAANGHHDRLRSQLQRFRIEQQRQLQRFRIRRHNYPGADGRPLRR